MTVNSLVIGLFGLAMLVTIQAHAEDCRPARLSARDAATVRALATRLGMKGPLQLCEDWVGAPGGCGVVRVDSPQHVDGKKVSWQRLYLGRGAKPPAMTCPGWEPGSKVLWQDGWVAAQSNLEDATSWRFTRGQRYVDVYLGQETRYEVADLIIRALDERTWQGRLDAAERELMAAWYSKHDRLQQITSIYGNDDVGYDVRFGEMGGVLVHVMVKAGVVTLARVSVYVV